MSWVSNSLGGGVIGNSAQWLVDNGLYNTEKDWNSTENLLNFGFLAASGVVGFFTAGTGTAAMIGGRTALMAGKGAVTLGIAPAKALISKGASHTVKLARIPLAEGTEASIKAAAKNFTDADVADFVSEKIAKSVKSSGFFSKKTPLSSGQSGTISQSVHQKFPGLDPLDVEDLIDGIANNTLNPSRLGGLAKKHYIIATGATVGSVHVRGNVVDSLANSIDSPSTENEETAKTPVEQTSFKRFQKNASPQTSGEEKTSTADSFAEGAKQMFDGEILTGAGTLINALSENPSKNKGSEGPDPLGKGIESLTGVFQSAAKWINDVTDWGPTASKIIAGLASYMLLKKTMGLGTNIAARSIGMNKLPFAGLGTTLGSIAMVYKMANGESLDTDPSADNDPATSIPTRDLTHAL